MSLLSFTQLPQTYQEMLSWPWARFEPYFQELLDTPLDSTTLEAWISAWSRLSEAVDEVYMRLYVATTVNTADKQAEAHYNSFLEEIYPQAQAADQKAKEKLLTSGLCPSGFERPLQGIQAEAAIFCAENLPLLAEELKLNNEYDQISGAQTIHWEGQELTLMQARPLMQDTDRARRETVWRLEMERHDQDRHVINDLWVRLLHLRVRQAANAGLPDYRAYCWQHLGRFDYTPQDCLNFHAAIEEVVVPAARRIYERRRQRLGVATLRPWDLDVDPLNRPALRPFKEVKLLEEKVAHIFQQVDPQLGGYFEILRRNGLLDLDNRKNKAPGGYCTYFQVSRLPFIFMNAVGIHDDVLTLLHEGGHCFHDFEKAHLPWMRQRQIGNEIAEVASMSMELLASPYLADDGRGFYSPAEAARARIEHLEGALLFWPYMAVVDAFQHWAYLNVEEAARPELCDQTWAALWERFMPGVDWSGFETEMATGWHRKPHIHQMPFYYVEYGLALLGALQIWRNASQDQARAVTAYRRALALGATRSLPELFAAAEVRFAMDAETLGQVIDLIENTLTTLEK